MYIVGIDPGLKGYIAISENEKAVTSKDFSDWTFHKMPIERSGGESLVDVKKLKELLDFGPTITIIEEPHLIFKQSMKAMRTTCMNFGRITSVLEFVGHAYRKIQASEWQLATQEACQGYTKPPVYRKSLSPKEVSLRAAQCLYSGEDSLFEESVHDGLVDALLIARYNGSIWLKNYYTGNDGRGNYLKTDLLKRT